MKQLSLIFIFVAMLAQGVQAQKALKIGSKAPRWKGIDQYGASILSTDFLDKSDIVVVFYRGQWCKYCNRQMFALQDSIEQIQNLGATVIAITPENNDAIGQTELKTGAKFSIIYDKKHKIMDAFEVSWKLGVIRNLEYKLVGIDINTASGNQDRALPVPATYIINKNGIIVAAHFDTDYSKRMPVSDILNVLKSIN